jgi:prepilin-type N-terminal cleavage/methylation domain-containing protein
MKADKLSSGFTLVELLVVIAIIGILVALLFPVFNTARGKAREASCMGNLHQIGIAIKAYEVEHHAYPPPPWYDGNRYQGGISALYPDYLTDKSLMICPEDLDAQKNSETAQKKVYSSYNGMVDFTTWQFKLNTDSLPLRLYNYYGYNNDGYDVFTPPGGANPYVSPVNSSLPTWLADQGLTWRAYPRLMNRYALDTTIITHCPFHRSRYGDNPTRQMDIVLRLNGKTDKVNVGPMSTPDSSGVSSWVTQK